MRLRLLACTSAIAIGCASLSAQAQETTTYQYDALGRLVGTSVSGGTNNGVSSTYALDAAGNRTGYTVTGGSSSTPTPSPTPTPSCTIQTVERSVTLNRFSVYSGSIYLLYSPSCSVPVVVSYSTRNGSAVAPTNYSFASGSVTIQPGQHDVPISINDMRLNGEEYLVFYLDFTIVSGNATLSGSSSQVDLVAD